MAYMSQDRKAEIAPVVKAILAKYNVKGSLSVRHHSTLTLNIKSGAVDFIGERVQQWGHDPLQDTTYLSVNRHNIEECYSGMSRECLIALRGAMMAGNHDHSDIQSDYFNVGWYIEINVGTWKVPYVLPSAPQARIDNPKARAARADELDRRHALALD